MRILISPAKKMNIDRDSPLDTQRPLFLAQTKVIATTLQGMNGEELQRLWKCNDALAQLNIERLAQMDLEQGLTPAILTYEGIQYRFMAPHVMEGAQLAYLQTHLRIVSGFYGLLRPFDGVTPYRLEMQAKLSVNGCKDLYRFWGNQLAQQLCQETNCVINLASQEYSRAIAPHLPKNIPMITCTFGERKDGRIVEKGTMCKMARGQMVRWLAENQVTDPRDITRFDQLSYVFSPEDSTDTHYIFQTVKEPTDGGARLASQSCFGAQPPKAALRAEMGQSPPRIKSIALFRNFSSLK